ncbi:MAG: TetR/AcrR family transcriptional regulator [Bacteroidia bacterium]
MLEKIIEGCDKLFRKFGIKSLSMDDIARELGISKKTIYQYFTDKNDLVNKTFIHILNYNESRCSCIKQENKNPVDEILMITRDVSQQMKGINPSVFYDLRKYHPESWQLFETHSNEFIYTQLKENLIRGKEQGLYRDDLHEKIVARLYISLIQTICNPELFSNIDYDFGSVYNEMIHYHFNGICTLKGRNYFNSKIS